MSDILNEQISTGSKTRVALKVGFTLLAIIALIKGFEVNKNLERKNTGFRYNS